MNFQKLPPVETSKQFLEKAFRKAREKGELKDLEGNWLQIIRKKNCMKLDIIKDILVTDLEKILSDFPQERGLPYFYIKLMKLTLDFPLFKKSLGAVNWASGRVKFFQKEYVRKVIKTKDAGIIRLMVKEFYGRISSVMKQIDSNLEYLEKSRRLMLSYPDIKDMFTVCIYGFPNVGKTTLLNKLTGTKAVVAAYAFTTRGINTGYFVSGDKKIQVLDVPGTLDRTDKINNIELQAELARKELAKVIVYVFDLSEESGYSVKQQEELFKSLEGDKEVLVYLSKRDLISEDKIKEFKKEHKGVRVLDMEGLKRILDNLYEEVKPPKEEKEK